MTLKIINSKMPKAVLDALEKVDDARAEYMKHAPAFDAAKLAYDNAPNVPMAAEAKLLPAEEVQRRVIAHRETWAAFEDATATHSRAKTAYSVAVGEAYRVFAECCIAPLPEEP